MKVTWTEQLSAWSTLATAILTLLLVVAAFVAWRTAKHTLAASRRASEAAEAANRQAQRDSIEQTRPYVFVELLPGLTGITAYDLRITNSGKSAARELVLSCDSWPQAPDDVAQQVRALFDTPRTLPPGSSLRTMWRLEGNFTDGTTVAGMGTSGRITVNYTSDDPSQPVYRDTFDVMTTNAGLWPVPEDGPNPDTMEGDALKFYRLGQALVRRVGELGR